MLAHALTVVAVVVGSGLASARPEPLKHQSRPATETEAQRDETGAPMDPSATAAAPADDPVLVAMRASFEEARRAKESKDFAGARARIAEAIESALATIGEREDADAIRLVAEMGRFAHDTGELPAAEKARRRVLDLRTRTLPDDDRQLQSARLSLAITLKTRGDRAGARELEEKVLEVRSRTLPDDHPDLQQVRVNLALTIKSLGDLNGARALEEKALEVYSRTLPDDHANLQTVRGNLATTLGDLGDLKGAQALKEKVLEVRSRTLPDDHPDLQLARGNLAITIKKLGDFEGARALEERVLEMRTRTLPDDHPHLQAARTNLAVTIRALGDFEGARVLQEKVLDVLSRTMPAEHPELATARTNLAITLEKLGDLARARALLETVLEHHPDSVSALTTLATTMKALGDLPAARALEERLLDGLSRTLPDDHPHLQAARHNLAVTLRALGDLVSARALHEKVLEVRSRALPDDHPELALSRQSLAITYRELGEYARAKELEERVLEIYSRTLPDDNPSVQILRGNLAITLKLLGDVGAARALAEKVFEVRSRTLPDDHAYLQAARGNLASAIVFESACSLPGAGTRETESERQRCAELMQELCRAQAHAVRTIVLSSPSREAEERCARLAKELDKVLSFARGYGVFERSPELEHAAFELSESARGAAIASAGLAHEAARSLDFAELRGALCRASEELAGLARKGATSEAFDSARRKREAAEQALIALARELAGQQIEAVDVDFAMLPERLGERTALVSFRRYVDWRIDGTNRADPSDMRLPTQSATESLCAFVVCGGTRANATEEDARHLTIVDLGPIEPIEAAVREWRDALGVATGRGTGAVTSSDSDARYVRSAGDQVRRLVFDPLLALIGERERVVLVVDDVLHLVAFDALPLGGDPTALLGDRWRIETRATVGELWSDVTSGSGEQGLLALGDVDYDGGESAAERPVEVAAVLRGGAWGSGFDALPATGDEARGIADVLAEASPEREAKVTLLQRSAANRKQLFELASNARFVHIATHGWFASESIRSWIDPEPIDEKTGLGRRQSSEEQVKSMSPMLLCGLALAGANLPEDDVGRAPGLITADEISTLDLSNCELAVLSACDTNVGECRAGQGVASLQRALQMAGARSVITSLWKVPDEATRELMVDFYRRMWIEKKPKHLALWEAKKKLRDAKEETGKPLYSTRDWAAWVLTGAPD